MNLSSKEGQSVIEILIAVAVGAVMIVAAAAALAPALRINQSANQLQISSALGKELLDKVKVAAEQDWYTLYSLIQNSSSTNYHFSTSSPFLPLRGEEVLNIDGINYKRYFYLEKVYRSTAQGGDIVPSGVYEDTATMKAVAVFGKEGAKMRTLSEYITRSRNRILSQTDWSGGVSGEKVRDVFGTVFSTSSNIEYRSSTGSIFIGPTGGTSEGSPFPGTNISPNPNEHWGWNDIAGWINFYDTQTVRVFNDKLEGYAWSSSSYEFALDCKTTPNGDTCSQSQWWVTNDGRGNLGGWGWNDTYGWISYSCKNHNGCGTSLYGVTIDGQGFFHDYAWNDVIGWISFNCADYNYCSISDYKVRTDWRPIAPTGTLDSVVIDLATPLLVENFENYGEGEDPNGWIDTEANNSTSSNDALFKTKDLGGNIAFWTGSSLIDIHSHYTSDVSHAWTNYEYTGRLRTDNSLSGIGVTFFSAYPSADRYYSLRGFEGSPDFYIQPHPENADFNEQGICSYPINPSINKWYRFKILVEQKEGTVYIKAKIWEDGSTEPSSWQIDCRDEPGDSTGPNPAEPILAGTIGIWSSGSGNKYWDDLKVAGNLHPTINSIVWYGDLPNSNTQVKFRVAATSSPEADWDSLLFNSTEYTGNPDTTIPLNTAKYTGYRYMKYRVILYSGNNESPRVDEVIINWSP